MFDFFISISKTIPLNIEMIEQFFEIFYKDGAKFNKYTFWDIGSKELTWDRYYNGEELAETEIETLDLKSLRELMVEKYLNGFNMIPNNSKTFTVVISPYNTVSYEISFSISSEDLNKSDEIFMHDMIEKIIEIFSPDLLVSGIEESVITIDENNFYQSNNIYKFYSSNLNLNIQTKKFEVEFLKNGIIFTNKEFFSNLENM